MLEKAYRYDEDNRLLHATVGSITNAFAYDYRTRRYYRATSTETNLCVFDGGLAVQEYDATSSLVPQTSNLQVEYLRGEGMGGGVGGMVYSIRGGNIICSHANHRGDIIARSNSSGSLTSFALYEAYGTRPYEWSDGVTGDPDRQKANTKEEETDLQLLNEGMRYRDLETGTFLTRDPIGYSDGPNVYCYVHCNPITRFDAYGLWKKDTHYGRTKKWATDKGFSPKDAKRIAKGCNGIDAWYKGKSPFPIIGRPSYHFNTSKEGEQDSREKHAQKHYDKAVKLWKKSEEQKAKGMGKSAKKTRDKALDELGKSLHPTQDPHAHDKNNSKKFMGIYFHKKKTDDGVGVDDAEARPDELNETEKATNERLDQFIIDTGYEPQNPQDLSEQGGEGDQGAQPASGNDSEKTENPDPRISGY